MKRGNMSQYNNIEIGNLLFGNSRGEYPVDREMALPLFAEFFGKFEIDRYGIPDENSLLSKTGSTNGEIYISVETDAFYIHPYYWGEDEKARKMPNFFYKPEGIGIHWYKYSMRDAYCNVELTKEKLQEILKKCIESVYHIHRSAAAPDTDQELKDFARKVDGIEYLEERKWLWAEAKEKGIVVVFGYSDDNIEFRGAVDDEIGCFDGRRVQVPGTSEHIDAIFCGMLDGKEVLDPSEYMTDDGDMITWVYRTNIHHETFMMYEDGEPYCRGIVFRLGKD